MIEQTYYLTDAERRDNAFKFIIGMVPLGQGWALKIFEHDETRREIQNRLMWHFNNQLKEHYWDQVGEQADYFHGVNKLHYLLPMRRAADPRRFDPVYHMLHAIDDYDLRVEVAYDAIRSNDIAVKAFSEYLNVLIQKWAERGVRLTTGEDLRFEEEARRWDRAA